MFAFTESNAYLATIMKHIFTATTATTTTCSR